MNFEFHKLNFQYLEKEINFKIYIANNFLSYIPIILYYNQILNFNLSNISSFIQNRL